MSAPKAAAVDVLSVVDLPRSRRVAAAASLPHFWPGLGCSRGHLGVRSSRTAECIDCAAIDRQKL